MYRRTAVLAALIWMAGCGKTSPAAVATKAAPAASPVTAPAPAPAVDAGSPSAAIAARLAARGYTIEALSPTETLACGAGGCVCLADLECDGSCITLEENLAVFADARKTGTVDCEIADTGKLCDFSFFRFEGDVYRWEQRYFAPSGRLAGIRNVTDYPAWCGGRARAQFTGIVPDCGQAPREVKVLCKDDRSYSSVANPAAQLELFLDGR